MLLAIAMKIKRMIWYLYSLRMIGELMLYFVLAVAINNIFWHGVSNHPLHAIITPNGVYVVQLGKQYAINYTNSVACIKC